MIEFDSATRFSNTAIQDLMVAFAKRVGMPHSDSDDGWFRYNESDTLTNESPDIAALDEYFGHDWLALVMDTQSQLEELQGELSQSSTQFAIQWTESQTMVILKNLADCPPAWINHQV